MPQQAAMQNRQSAMFFWPVEDRPTVARGEGIYLWDEAGKRYIDACAGPQTCNIGHGNARVLAAMAEQAGRVCYTFRPFMKNEPAEELAHELVAAAPPGLDRVFFCSGGSEAVEGAIKLARQYALAKGEGQRFRIVSRLPSYHGTTLGALSLTGDPQMAGPFAPMMPNMPKIPAPFCAYRPAGQSLEDAALGYANRLEQVIQEQGPETMLAFIMEPVGGAATGALTAPDIYYRRVREICDRYGLVLIFDEVMSGAGRTGKFLAAEHFGVTPDIAVLAKGLAAGYMPLGAIMAPARMVDAVEAAGGFAHAHTYSASPLACAVGRAVLAEMREGDLMGNATRMGALMQARLGELAAEFPFIGEVRGRGLLLGFDIVADRATGRPLPPARNFHLAIQRAAMARGLMIYTRRLMGGLRGDNFMVSPPLTLGPDDVAEIAGLLRQALADVAPEILAAMRSP